MWGVIFKKTASRKETHHFMDPDSWPYLQLIVSLVLLPPSLVRAGVSIEEAGHREIADSGVGASITTISSMFVTGVLLIFAGDALLRTARLLSRLALAALSVPSALPGALLTAALFVLFLFLLLLLCVFFLTWGRAHSDQYEGRMRWFDPLLCVVAPFGRVSAQLSKRALTARGMTEELGTVTEEDVLELVDSLVESTEERDVIDETQREMITNIFEFDDITAGTLMTHRTELEAVPADASPAELIKAAVAVGYSRIPVYDGTVDNIIGIAYAKDLLRYLGSDTNAIDVRGMVRPALFVPESMRARQLLIEFRQNRVQFAVVVDEYGGTAGIVTMEDILESIVGDIEDEYDEEDTTIVVNPDGSATCDGYADIDEVLGAFGIDEVPDDVDSETVGGLITDLLKRLPEPDEHPTVAFQTLCFTVLESDERRIIRVLVRPAELIEDSGESSSLLPQKQ